MSDLTSHIELARTNHKLAIDAEKSAEKAKHEAESRLAALVLLNFAEQNDIDRYSFYTEWEYDDESSYIPTAYLSSERGGELTRDPESEELDDVWEELDETFSPEALSLLSEEDYEWEGTITKESLRKQVYS